MAFAYSEVSSECQEEKNVVGIAQVAGRSETIQIAQVTDFAQHMASAIERRDSTMSAGESSCTDDSQHQNSHPKCSNTRVCKYCYSDENLDEWLSPCRCMGTIKWVHRSCFHQWILKAPIAMRYRCSICKYVYRKRWALKPYKLWSWPNLNLGVSDVFEIYLDASLTYRLVRDFPRCLDDKFTFLVYSLYAALWRLFVATNSRLTFYFNLGSNLASSIFCFTILNSS